MNKPLSLRRKEYINAMCSITNKCGLPAFIVVEALEKILAEMRKIEKKENDRDEAMWHNALNKKIKEEKKVEAKINGDKNE